MPKGLQGFQPGNKIGGKTQLKPKICLTCLYCKKEFKVQPWETKNGRRKYCSQSCRSSYTMQGEKHWNWQGGISNKWDKLHNSKEYKKWRLTVWQRDRFTCQHCSAKQSRKNPLNAHHIKPKASFPDLILDISNGQTLCKFCHDVVHYSRSGRHG